MSKDPPEVSYGQLLVWISSCEECGSSPQSRKDGSELSWKMQRRRGVRGQTTGGNMRPFQEELELLRHSKDLRFEGSLMRQAFCAGKSGDWGNFLENEGLSAWTSVKVRECHSEVEQEDDGRKSIAQQILYNSTDFLRRIIVPVEGQGGITLSYVCPIAHYIWWVSSAHRKKQCNSWCAACGGQYDRKIQTESWSYRMVRTALKQRFSVRALRHREHVTTWWAQAPGESAERWRQPNQHGCRAFWRNVVSS